MSSTGCSCAARWITTDDGESVYTIALFDPFCIAHGTPLVLGDEGGEDAR